MRTDLGTVGSAATTHHVTLYVSGNVKSDRNIQRNLIYEYYDEDFYGDRTGRVLKKTSSSGAYTVYNEYWPDTDTVKTSKDYNAAGNLLRTQTFDSRGRRISSTAAQAVALAFDTGYFEMLEQKEAERAGISPYNLSNEVFVSPHS